jgi:hypothetical protein
VFSVLAGVLLDNLRNSITWIWMIIMQKLSLLLGSIITLTFNFASAALVKTDITVGVTGSGHSGINNGETFIFSSIYDDSSTRMSRYDDGPNEKGQFGQDDDIPIFTWCTYGITSGCDHTFSDPTIVYLSDAKINYQSFYDKILNSEKGYDVYDNNSSWTFGYSINDKTQINILADDMRLDLNYVSTSTDNGGKFRTHTNSNFYDTYFNIVSFNTTTVPEPSIIALMLTGLFGLGISRRRIKK